MYFSFSSTVEKLSVTFQSIRFLGFVGFLEVFMVSHSNRFPNVRIVSNQFNRNKLISTNFLVYYKQQRVKLSRLSDIRQNVEMQF